ncbi:hypothetical protein LWI29_023488 [Acer saccharum]|uniref:ENTH domain-containing protein n=1 Tax=Acer saccharum TaxID=4024 RepID=A0AA39SMR0_ACESA|nr:hypothetical protein LWI29_023488 [Acer saccharum]KAK1571001.1 hypothetical protein Q3G72_010314 [Acer saccharum]
MVITSPISFHKFKTQASFYLKEKIKTARLVLTDVTPAELLTEEATNGNPWPPDTQTMGVISRAAFEVDDYWRIVEILHQRLLKFDRKNWRASYNALVLLEYLITHGPKRVAEEFKSDEGVIREILKNDFQYIDERGFNWGLRVRKLSERILELLESDQALLNEERSRARKLTREIKGFGSFGQRCSTTNESCLGDYSSSTTYGRCNSDQLEYKSCLEEKEVNKKVQVVTERQKQKQNSKHFWVSADQEENHPFCQNELETTTSLCLLDS